MRQTSFSLLLLLILGAVESPSRSLDLSFSSESIKVYVKPGQAINRSFSLTLDKKEQPTRFNSHMEDWWKSEDGKQSFYREIGTLQRSCGKWVQLNPVEAEVQPGGKLVVRLSIAVPEDAKPGGYWGALTVDEVPNPLDNPEGVGIRFNASISVGVFIYVLPLDRQVEIAGLQMDANQIALKLRNKGNCPLGVEGRYEFLEPNAKKPKATVPIARTTVLPEPINTALVLTALPKPQALPTGRYMVRIVLDIGLDHLIGAQKELEIKRDALKAPASP